MTGFLVEITSEVPQLALEKHLLIQEERTVTITIEFDTFVSSV